MHILRPFVERLTSGYRLAAAQAILAPLAGVSPWTAVPEAASVTGTAVGHRRRRVQATDAPTAHVYLLRKQYFFLSQPYCVKTATIPIALSFMIMVLNTFDCGEFFLRISTWGGAAKTNLIELERAQRIILKCNYTPQINSMMNYNFCQLGDFTS